jgi:hypothetical protein
MVARDLANDCEAESRAARRRAAIRRVAASEGLEDLLARAFGNSGSSVRDAQPTAAARSRVDADFDFASGRMSRGVREQIADQVAQAARVAAQRRWRCVARPAQRDLGAYARALLGGEAEQIDLLPRRGCIDEIEARDREQLLDRGIERRDVAEDSAMPTRVWSCSSLGSAGRSHSARCARNSSALVSRHAPSPWVKRQCPPKGPAPAGDVKSAAARPEQPIPPTSAERIRNRRRFICFLLGYFDLPRRRVGRPDFWGVCTR